LVFQGYLLTLHPWIADTDTILVADLYDPFHLESLEWERFRPLSMRWNALETAVGALNDQLLRADYFMCASERQRHFWLGHLGGLGRINPATYDADETLSQLVSIVPFGISEHSPTRTAQGIRGRIAGIDSEDYVLLWGGGVYNWFDPLTLIDAVALLAADYPRLRLVFLGMQHPTEGIPEMRMAVEARNRALEKGLTGRHVFFNEVWVPYSERSNYLLDADVGVSCHLDHVETEFSFRTRILDYLWAGLPVVCTAGDSFGDLVDSESLGGTARPGDATALASALGRILGDPAYAEACRENVARVRSAFLWNEVATPLLDFCRTPSPAADRREGSRPHDGSGTELEAEPTHDIRGGRWSRDYELLRHYLRHEGLGGAVRRARGRIVRVLSGRTGP
jgi:glycosyltransferase involved in cell wall biosynthesis